jgi:rapamycin-insensitive companion of mTOR
MSNRILPSQYAAQLQVRSKFLLIHATSQADLEQALPRLFTGATKFTNPNEMTGALSALSSIDSLARNQAKAVNQATKDRSR